MWLHPCLQFMSSVHVTSWQLQQWWHAQISVECISNFTQSAWKIHVNLQALYGSVKRWAVCTVSFTQTHFFFSIPWKWTTECFETDCGHNLWIEICFENIELLLSTYAQFWNFNVLHKQLFLVTNYKRDISHFLVVSPLFDCPLCYPVVLPRCVIPLCCPVPAGSKSSSRSPVVSPREMRNEKHTDDKQYFISTYFIQQHQYHSIPKFQYHGWKRMNINVSYFVGEGLGGMFS